ncbi:MAG: sensor hybrid histidine kinase [Pseudomonas sp.]|nr:sensor hybrid histidine kinase [Pseudomonas sp.]
MDTLKYLSREELESEVTRLRLALEGEARQRAIFESAIDFAMIVTDPSGTITDWNPGATHVMGWTAEEMRGHGAERFFTPADRASGRIEQEMQRALSQGRSSDERWHLRKDGQVFWASGEMMPLFADDNAHLGFVKILRDRTKEHLTGRAIVETQERYRLAVKATSDAIWDWDLTTNQVIWNEALQQAYGYPLATLDTTGDWRIEHIHPDDRARVEASIHEVIVGLGTAWSDEYRFRRLDGSYAEVLDRGHVIRNVEGQAVRMIGAMLDLTRSRRAETALRQSEERFSTILETIETAFAIVQVKFDANDHPVDYCFLEANPAFERHAGVNLHGKWVTEFAPDLERFWFDTYGHVAKTGEPANFENYANTFERWFDVRAVRVGDPDDRQIAIFFSDVTERRDAQERLRTSEAVARENVERVQLALAAGAIIGTWHWDLSTDRFSVDEGFARVFDLDPALGQDGLSLEQVGATIHPEDRDGVTAAINAAIARGGAYSYQYRVRRADGKYNWIEANGRVDCAEDGTPLRFPGVLIDVEERRNVEAERDRATAALRALNDTLEQRVSARTAELMQTEEKLRQSQKMEAVGQLTGGLAHDFNNLLAGISGALELMSHRIAQGRVMEVDKYIVTAQGAAKRAAALTHRLLAFSRRQTLDPRPTDVNALMAGMTELIQRMVGPSIQVETSGATDLWPALVDASQLENSLLNLCINARDAMPNGGRITIETANRSMDLETTRTLDMPEGQYLSICVTDTGTGMTPDVIAKAFDPFFTTKPLGQGTGLGLSMIYGFAKQSGGQVRVYSEVGQGTTMCIYLPRYFGDAVPEQDDAENKAIPLTKAGETILIVDDEPTVRLLLTEVLGEIGFTLIEAADSIAGLKVLRSDVHIDLLITDVGLPGGMNGRQMADAGREVRPQLKTLFITGYAENAVVGNGQLGPGMQVLTKPFAVDTLVTRVRELMSAKHEET